MDIRGPKIRETWKLGAIGPIVFIGMAYDIYCDKHFIFTEDDKDKSLFTMTKEYFYHDISALRVLNEISGEWEKAEQ